jgi:hypothetical protein
MLVCIKRVCVRARVCVRIYYFLYPNTRLLLYMYWDGVLDHRVTIQPTFEH